MDVQVYKISLFGDFNKYTPESNRIIELTNALNKTGEALLPNVITVNQTIINIPASSNQDNIQIQTFSFNADKSEKRIQFISTDEQTSLTIFSERIDVELFINSKSDFMVLLNRSRMLMKAVLDSLDAVDGNRIAFYIDAVIPETNNDYFSKFLENNNLNIVIDDSVQPCFEWHHHFNNRLKINVNSKNELTNAIFDISLVSKKTDNKIKGIRIIADINTIPENINNRFNMDDISSFIESAQSLFLNVVEQIKNQL